MTWDTAQPWPLAASPRSSPGRALQTLMPECRREGRKVVAAQPCQVDSPVFARDRPVRRAKRHEKVLGDGVGLPLMF